MKLSTVILLRKLASSQEDEREAKRVIDQLQKKGYSKYSHESGTYMIIVPISVLKRDSDLVMSR